VLSVKRWHLSPRAVG